VASKADAALEALLIASETLSANAAAAASTCAHAVSETVSAMNSLGDNLQLVCGLKVKAVEALLHDRLELHEVVIVRVGEHRVHLLG
jgi:hypothetical protein